MTTPVFSNFKKKDSYTLTFDVANCDTSFVNAIRRTIITDVVTLGFNTDDYENSDLKIFENTCALHNEFILHSRINSIHTTMRNF